MTTLPLSLQTLLDKGILPPSLLFTGSSAAELRAAAQEVAVQLLGEPVRGRLERGNHPDVHLLQIEAKSRFHSMETILSYVETSRRPPFEAARQIFIIEEAEQMLSPSAHALLKTLEEPPPTSLFILLTSDPDTLLPTLLARLRKIQFMRACDLDAESASHLASFFLAPSENLQLEQIAHIEKICVQEELLASQRKALHMLELVLFWFRDLHLCASGCDPAHLRYPPWQQALNAYLQCRGEPPSLERVLQRVDIYREALACHVKLRACLQALMSDF